jgi:hypothetical protein
MVDDNFVRVDSIPEPPPPQWENDAPGSWTIDGRRVMRMASGKWAVFESVDTAWEADSDGWAGPFGAFDTAEEAMQADIDEIVNG